MNRRSLLNGAALAATTGLAVRQHWSSRVPRRSPRRSHVAILQCERYELTPRAVEDGSLPACNTRMGEMAEARNAGARPNRSVVDMPMSVTNPSTRASIRRSRWARKLAGARRLTMAGAAVAANISPKTHAANAIRPLSMSICWRRRPRPAPMEIRTAISRSRPVARATRRFATLEDASSTTTPAISARIHRGRSNFRLKLAGTADAGRNSNFALT